MAPFTDQGRYWNDGVTSPWPFVTVTVDCTRTTFSISYSAPYADNPSRGVSYRLLYRGVSDPDNYVNFPVISDDLYGYYFWRSGSATYSASHTFPETLALTPGSAVVKVLIRYDGDTGEQHGPGWWAVDLPPEGDPVPLTEVLTAHTDPHSSARTRVEVRWNGGVP